MMVEGVGPWPACICSASEKRKQAWEAAVGGEGEKGKGMAFKGIDESNTELKEALRLATERAERGEAIARDLGEENKRLWNIEQAVERWKEISDRSLAAAADASMNCQKGIKLLDEERRQSERIVEEFRRAAAVVCDNDSVGLTDFIRRQPRMAAQGIIDRWVEAKSDDDALVAKGYAKGLEEGAARGLMEGRSHGLEEGYKKGFSAAKGRDL